jgi:Ca2+-binding EF-hand superfamily protein
MQEFKGLLVELGLQYVSESDVDGLYRGLDKDNSGSLEYAELVIMKDLMRGFSFMQDVGNGHEDIKKEKKLGHGLQPFTSASIGLEKLYQEMNTKLIARSKKSRSARAVPSANTLLKLIRHHDDNDNGSINKSELMSLLTELGLQYVSQKDVDDLFAKLDTNNDGQVNYDEFQCMKDLRKQQQTCGVSPRSKASKGRKSPRKAEKKLPPKNELPEQHEKYNQNFNPNVERLVQEERERGLSRDSENLGAFYVTDEFKSEIDPQDLSKELSLRLPETLGSPKRPIKEARFTPRKHPERQAGHLMRMHAKLRKKLKKKNRVDPLPSLFSR